MGYKETKFAQQRQDSSRQSESRPSSSSGSEISRDFASMSRNDFHRIKGSTSLKKRASGDFATMQYEEPGESSRQQEISSRTKEKNNIEREMHNDFKEYQSHKKLISDYEERYGELKFTDEEIKENHIHRLTTSIKDDLFHISGYLRNFEEISEKDVGPTRYHMDQYKSNIGYIKYIATHLDTENPPRE